MKLTQLRLSNFQSFGPVPSAIQFEDLTYLLGPNGSGKTAVLQALARMFATDPQLRRVQRSDFHSQKTAIDGAATFSTTLWVEAQFEFPELREPGTEPRPTIASNYSHLTLVTADAVPRVRFRLTANLDEDGDVEELFQYVIAVDSADEPSRVMAVNKHDRNEIQVHYLPARRDPADHISYAANSLLGRLLRSADWQIEQGGLAELTGQISQLLAGNAAIGGIDKVLASTWNGLHKGTFYAKPSISFDRNEMDSLLRHLTVGFTPGHDAAKVDFSRLSDGQQSLLYITLVLTSQAIASQVLKGSLKAFDVLKLRPALFTLIAMEEPENSLSPHYLGRVIKSLKAFSAGDDGQAIIATHAPALLRRVDPEHIRYLRLTPARHTQVTQIVMPDKADVAHKFVQEAVKAFPELYFSRLVILGEGDSEEIVIPRLLQAAGVAEDDSSVVVAPLGGRHVNHFWRLLNGLQIPYVTLLDLDLGRHQAGWGRLKYAVDQLGAINVIDAKEKQGEKLPKWNGVDHVLTSTAGVAWVNWLEGHGVFYSSPLDLDFSMMTQFSIAYGVTSEELVAPVLPVVLSVLGKAPVALDQYSDLQKSYFGAYHARFKLGSKPAEHIAALATLSDVQLLQWMPPSISRLIAMVKSKLESLPE